MPWLMQYIKLVKKSWLIMKDSWSKCLALLLALQHFDVYLNTTVLPVLVYTDHNPLTFVNKLKEKNQRLLRWSLTLQEYDLDIRHVRGKDNVIADALSRTD